MPLLIDTHLLNDSCWLVMVPREYCKLIVIIDFIMLFVWNILGAIKVYTPILFVSVFYQNVFILKCS